MRMFLSLVFATALAAATMTADTVPATGGDIEITPIRRASVQIEQAGKVIQVDPVGKGDYSKAKPADLILVTDIHDDNLDPDEIAKRTISAQPKRRRDTSIRPGPKCHHAAANIRAVTASTSG